MLLALLELDHHSVGHCVGKQFVGGLGLLFVMTVSIKSEAFLDTLKLILEVLG